MIVRPFPHLSSGLCVCSQFLIVLLLSFMLPFDKQLVPEAVCFLSYFADRYNISQGYRDDDKGRRSNVYCGMAAKVEKGIEHEKRSTRTACFLSSGGKCMKFGRYSPRVNTSQGQRCRRLVLRLTFQRVIRHVPGNRREAMRLETAYAQGMGRPLNTKEKVRVFSAASSICNTIGSAGIAVRC